MFSICCSASVDTSSELTSSGYNNCVNDSQVPVTAILNGNNEGDDDALMKTDINEVESIAEVKIDDFNESRAGDEATKTVSENGETVDTNNVVIPTLDLLIPAKEAENVIKFVCEKNRRPNAIKFDYTKDKRRKGLVLLDRPVQGKLADVIKSSTRAQQVLMKNAMIVKINDVEGDAEALEQELLYGDKAELTVARHFKKPNRNLISISTVFPKTFTGLGIKIDLASNPSEIVVNQISFGPVLAHNNAASEDQQIRVGHRIVCVNNLRDNAVAMVEEIMSAETLEMEFS